MNIHEYQAKQLFAEYNMPVSPGEVVYSIDEVEKAVEKLGTEKVVVKAQVHAGGRGKAGGVKLASSLAEVKQYVDDMLGIQLVTYQTDSNGQPVNSVLLEKCSDIANELYLGAVIDRTTQRLVIMASTEGGVEIETVAAETPEKILQVVIDPLIGVLPFQGREVGFKLGLNADQIKQFTKMMLALGKMFMEKDLALVEINPLIIKTDGDLLCLDGKVGVDENALYRHPELQAMRDKSQENEKENRAFENQLNYIALDGDIGCMVNGAGLAMATMDLIKLHGGSPANFLDVGGTATAERVTEAFKIILSDSTVKAVFVNIFGGIVRCDNIAEGIISAVKEVGIEIPVIVRLQGNNAEKASQLLADSGLSILAENDLTEAAKLSVKSVK